MRLPASLLLLTLTACAGVPADRHSYVAPDAINIAATLPPYPPVGSAADQADIAAFNALEVTPDSEGWQAAFADADGYGSDALLALFSDAAGTDLTRARMPVLAAMFDRMDADLHPAVDRAKRQFDRSRPIYRFNIARFCNTKFKVQTDSGDAYPSGHAARGWAAGLLLARAMPDRAGAILARAAQYGDSRVTCRVHYPSDVRAGQLLATAYITRALADAAFNDDLTAAQDEIAATRRQDD